jgi:hypothetical protein
MQPVSDRGERHPGRSIRFLLVSAALVAALAVPAAAFAGKGGGGGSSTAWIALATVSGAAAAAAEPRVGSTVKFSSGYPTGTKNAWVSLSCYQGETLVYAEGGKPSADFVLGGAWSVWATTGGGASCRAELGDLYWRGGKQYYTYLAHTNFEAGA